MKKFLFAFVLFFSSSSLAKLTWDLGVSFGSSGDNDYNEINLGVNYFISDVLVWRNAAFSRNFSDDAIEDRYGLDTSARFNFLTDLGEAGRLHLFGGPGWRFISSGKNPPFAEGGISVTLGGLRVGGGAKFIMNKVIDGNLENDTQFFVTFSGGGTIGGSSE